MSRAAGTGSGAGWLVLAGLEPGPVRGTPGSRAGERRRRRAGWLLFWAVAAALAPAGRCLALLGAGTGRR